MGRKELPLNLTTKGGPLRKHTLVANLTEIGARIMGQHPLFILSNPNVAQISQSEYYHLNVLYIKDDLKNAQKTKTSLLR